jgi:HEAT repeat protein
MRSFVILVLILAWNLSPAFAAQEKEPVFKGKALSERVKDLKSPEAEIRRRAVLAIRDTVPLQTGQVPALIEMLKDEDDKVREYAASAVGWVGRKDPRAVQPLIGTFKKDKSIFVRSNAADALSFLQPYPKEAIPAFLDGLKNPHPNIRSSSASGLWRSQAPEAIGPLTAALKDSSIVVRGSAASSLGNWGPEAKEAVPLLIELLKALPTEKDNQLLPLLHATARRNAATALGRISRGSDVAVNALVAALNDTEVGPSAAQALGEIGPQARPAIEPLKEWIKTDKDARIRIHAAAAVMRIDPKFSKSSLTILIDGLNDKRSFVRHNAVGALEDLGPVAKEAVPALLGLVKDKDLGDRAATALRKIDPEAAKKAGVP